MTSVTVDGCPFGPDLAVWRVRTPTAKVLFDFALPNASPALIMDLRRTLADMLLRQRPEGVYNTLSRCRQLTKFASSARGTPIGAFGLNDFEAYRRSLDVDQLYLASDMLAALKSLDRAGFRSIDEDLRRELPTMAVVFPRRASPARTACPRLGPLTQAELAAAAAALQRAWADAKVTTARYALCMLALALRPRPGQAALLKVGDLLGPDSDAPPEEVTMPLIKGRRRGAPPLRAGARRLHPDVGVALARQRTDALAWGTARGMAAADCPLFPSNEGVWRREEGPQLPWTVGHSTSTSIGQQISNTFSALDLSAMRANGEERRILATRLRRSLATSARSAGCTFGQVSQLLWHAGLSAAAIYTGPSVGLIERVEQAVDFRPLAALYQRELEDAAS